MHILVYADDVRYPMAFCAGRSVARRGSRVRFEDPLSVSDLTIVLAGSSGQCEIVEQLVGEGGAVPHCQVVSNERDAFVHGLFAIGGVHCEIGVLCVFVVIGALVGVALAIEENRKVEVSALNAAASATLRTLPQLKARRDNRITWSVCGQCSALPFAHSLRPPNEDAV